MLLLESAIEIFLEERHYKQYVPTGLFSRVESARNLLDALKEKHLRQYLQPDMLNIAIIDTIKSYNSNKQSAITLFKSFLIFLKEEYGFEAQVDFPAEELSNSLFRQLQLVKTVQNKEVRIEELEDMFWVSSRTIYDDLEKLENQKSPLSIFGKPFIVDGLSRSRGIIKLESTVHPLFLSFNLTQVIATLQGLHRMSRDQRVERYATLSAATIWQQLSDYGKNRILEVMEQGIFPDDTSWYKDLDEEDLKSFYSEKECSSPEGESSILNFMKNGKRFFLEYRDETTDKSLFFNVSRVKMGEEETYEITTDKGIRIIQRNRIIGTAERMDDLL